MLESLCIASTIASADIAMERFAGKSAVYNKYGNGPRTLPYGTLNWILKLSIITSCCLMKKCLSLR